MRLFPQTTVPGVAFCERCGEVGDARCRADGDRERTTVELLTRGVRLP